MDIENIKKEIRDVILLESVAISQLPAQIHDDYARFVSLLIDFTGIVVVSGLGKSGIIGKKIAATMSSLGIKSCFIHASEALHGDFGFVSSGDLLLALSYSGETGELLQLVAAAQARNIRVVSLTGHADSTLAKNSDIALSFTVANEACHLNAAPTSSSTAMLVIGDAIAVTVSKLRNFQLSDFAVYHPGGSLGKLLLKKVKDVIKSGPSFVIDHHEPFSAVISRVTKTNVGAIMVVKEHRCVGIITDGDVRRCLQKYERSAFDLVAENFMTVNPITIEMDQSLDVAYQLMTQNRITNLVVLDTNRSPLGMCHLHAFW